MKHTVHRSGQGDDVLHLSFDRKVSPRGWYQKSRDRWVATIPNSFGLPAGTSCPGKTEFCVSCYADHAENSAGVAGLVNHNLELLQAACDVDAMAELIDEMLVRYERHADYAGIDGRGRVFRIHWDGDFFSADYATAWSLAAHAHPSIDFWTYTRSFVPALNVAPILAAVPNLALYLSVDAANAEHAPAVLDAYDVNVALCGSDYNRARALLDRPSAIRCPENAGRIALMTNGTGACVECAICTVGRRDILFATSHVDDASAPVAVAITRRPHGGDNSAREGLPTHCLLSECGKPLPPPNGRGRHRRYCNRSCQTRAHYLNDSGGSHE